MNIDDFLSKEEQKVFRQGSDWQGAMGFCITWLAIVGVAAVYALWPGLLTAILALIVFANRQMALGVLMHDCSHRSWFRTPRLNEFFGHWFAGMPVLVPLSFYRRIHFIHHTRTGTEDDPDVGNINAYPVTKDSMQRKIVRDFTGQSGFKNVLALLRYVNTGRAGNAVSMGVNRQGIKPVEIRQTTLRNYSHLFLVHGGWLVLASVSGRPEVYLLWWIAFIFIYPFILRIRQVAEHGAMPELASDDVRENTRTTIPRWWERFVFSPHFVNYHCEHHSLPTVAGYRLPQLHRMLKERGFYKDKSAALVAGYAEVIRIAQRGEHHNPVT